MAVGSGHGSRERAWQAVQKAESSDRWPQAWSRKSGLEKERDRRISKLLIGDSPNSKASWKLSVHVLGTGACEGHYSSKPRQ